MVITILAIFVLIICDQFIKNYIHHHFFVHQSHVFIKNVLNLTYIRNDGAGWGFFSGQRTFFILITLVVIIYLIYLLFKNKNKSWKQLIWIGFIIAGAIGNLIDRIYLGYVVDMFELAFINFPIFNLADVALTFGVLGLMLATIFSSEEESII